MTAGERRLGRCLRLSVLLFAGFAASYVAMGVLGDAEFPFVANSTAKDGLFAAIALIGSGDPRRHAWAALVIVVGHAIIVGCLVLALVLGDVGAITGTLQGPLPDPTVLALAWAAAAGAIAVAFFVLRRAALRDRYGLRYLGPGEFLTLAALSEVLVDGEPAVPAAQVAGNTDAYLADFDAQGKWRIRLALLALSVVPLLTLRPPFPEMSPDARTEFLRKRFVESVAVRWLPEWLRVAQQSMIRAAAQMSYIGYYRDPRSYPACGYRPLERRAQLRRRLEESPSPAPARLECLLPGNVADDFLAADVVVVGTGAGGATVAAGLAGRGREVLLVERGPHVDPTRFSSDEATQLARLYRDGALTLSRDFRFQVLQGMCVGGSTVVNNAVCFDLPDSVLDRWNGERDAGLDRDRLRASFARLRRDLPVRRQDDPSRLNPGHVPFMQGLARLGLDAAPYEAGPVEANLDACLGCGFCNSGCAHGRKLSMLDRTLPRAQGEHGADNLRILAETQVLEVRHDGGVATGVRCRMSDGRRVDIRANTVVLAAGALASSVILRRSGIGGDRVGRGLAFNLACPIVADLPEAIDSTEGLQISHYLRVPGDGVALETWYQPLLGMALFMPGWFGDHRANMRRYNHLAAVGVVVGSENGGSVRPGRLGHRTVALDYRPSRRDLQLMLGGIRLAARVMLAGGATRVMPPTFAYRELRHVDGLDAFVATIRDNSDLSINSAHPQSGNPISADPRRGVVDEHLRVHGFDNLHVCDASVFPTAITVNPQLTVMALADYAVAGIA